MKKLTILLSGIALVWLSILSYHSWQITQQSQQLAQQLHQSKKDAASLNDRLVALQRQAMQPTAVKTPEPTEAKTPQIQPLALIQQQLDLIEFALQQQQYGYALEKLEHLDMQLLEYDMAEPLKQSLIQALIQDRQNIQSFVNERQQQQQKVNQLLHQLDQDLTREAQQPNLKVNAAADAPFWQQWLKLEPADQAATQLMQRQFVLKEAQLHLLLARQLLLQGQSVAYQQEMTTVIAILNRLPDQHAQALRRQLESVQGITTLPTPSLTTRALLR